MSASRQYTKGTPVKKTRAKGPRRKETPKPVKPVKPVMLDLAAIRLDGGTQSRAKIDGSVAFHYSEDIVEGATFPPVVVFHDGETYWLGDGFHRHRAHDLAGKSKIAAEVRQGTRRDAILHSVGANETHGLKRSREDRFRAVKTLLDDQEWSAWSNHEIARRCAVSHEYVRQVRADLTGNVASDRTYRTKHGTVATMDTTAIGKRPDSVVSVAEVPDTADIIVLSDQPEGTAALHEQVRATLPQAIKDREQAKAEWRAKAAANPENLHDRIAELEEAVRLLEAENEALKAESKLYAEMRVQFEQGGFAKVVADKDEEIRTLSTRVAAESEDKANWAKSARYWKKRAKELGDDGDALIPLDEKPEESLIA